MRARRSLSVGCAALAASVALAGCGGDATPPDPSVTIGSKGFTESAVAAAAYSQALRRIGFQPTIRDVGATPALARALRAGTVDLYPEYTGTAWTIVEGKPVMSLVGKDPAQQAQMVRDLLAASDDLHAFPPAPGSNNASAVCTRASGITSLADLADRPVPVSLAASAEVFTRRDALQLLANAYGFTVGRKVVTDPDDRYAPIARGEVECMAAYETDPQIASLGLVVLRDPLHVMGGAVDYRPMALANGAWWRSLPEETQAKVDEAIANVSRKMTTAWLRDANRRVAEEGARPEDVALELVNISVPGRAAAPR